MKKQLPNLTYFAALFLAVLTAAILLGACSKDKDSPSTPTHTVVFKGFVSDGSNIYAAVYGVDEEITTETSLSGITWSSETITTPAGAQGVAVDVLATGDNENASLIVQIFVDGELKTEAKAEGIELEALASYDF